MNKISILRILTLTILFASNIMSQDLVNSITTIDSILKNEKAILYARRANDKYVKVRNEHWPDDLVESINIVKSEGKVRLIRILPFSQSGDWSYETDSYFDKEGRLIGYVETKNHFNSMCLDGAIHRKKIFVKKGNQFELVKSSILDSKGNDVSNLKCQDPYQFEPSIVQNLKTYLATIGMVK